jgi:elongation factor G
MEEFISLEAQDPYMTFPSSKIIPHLRSLTLQNEILPVFSGSALHHIGTKVLMDYIGELLASPLDVKGDIESDGRSSVSVLAWKVGWDRQKGWMTFVRVYSGKDSSNNVSQSSNAGNRLSIALFNALQYYNWTKRTHLEASPVLR